jgi:hypothetical protein
MSGELVRLALDVASQIYPRLPSLSFVDDANVTNTVADTVAQLFPV